METVSVIGSCACRDLFEKDTNNFSFHTDIRFASPISMMGNPLSHVIATPDNFIKNVKVVNGKWYRKNVIHEINKTYFDALQQNHGEYLILDFAESRIPVAEISFKNSSKKLLVTYSSAFQAHYNASFSHNILKNTDLKIINPLEFDDNYWKQIVNSFSEQIKKIFKEEKIILIKNRPARFFIDADGFLHPYYSDFHFNMIMICDILLEKINNYFLEACPNCKVIDVPKYAIGNQKHKWGNHPFHFTETYYEYLLACVKKIIIEKQPDKLIDIYSDYSKRFASEFGGAKIKTAERTNKKKNDTYLSDLLRSYEEFNNLGRKQKIGILFSLDKKNFFKNLKNLKK